MSVFGQMVIAPRARSSSMHRLVVARSFGRLKVIKNVQLSPGKLVQQALQPKRVVFCVVAWRVARSAQRLAKLVHLRAPVWQDARLRVVAHGCSSSQPTAGARDWL